MTISLLFSLLVFAVAGVIIRASFRKFTGVRDQLIIPIAIVGWFAYTAAMVSSGTLNDHFSMPPPQVKILLPGLLLTLYIVYSKRGAQLRDNFSFAAIIGLQLFRFPLELLLSALHTQGFVPVEMTFHGLNFDILTGITAPVIAYLAYQGKISRSGILLWNTAGLLLLINVVTIAILSMPGKLQVLTDGPANTLVFQLPYVWITFFVFTALASHLLIFRKLAIEKKLIASKTASTRLA